MPYTIRPALHEEIVPLGSLQLEAAKRFSPEVLPEPMRSTYTVPPEYLEEALDRNGLWVAVDDNGALRGMPFSAKRTALRSCTRWTCCPPTASKGWAVLLWKR